MVLSERKTLPLPYCHYPTAAEPAQHGHQPLPDPLPLADFKRVESYRSSKYNVVRASTLNPQQLVQLARGMGRSFAKRDPVSRHLILPPHPPAYLEDVEHTDALGTESFGSWTLENLIYWFVRTFLITTPGDNMRLNEEVLSLSYVMMDGDEVIGGSFFEPLPPTDEEPTLEPDDDFRMAVMEHLDPIFSVLGFQNAECTGVLSAHSTAFQQARAAGKIVHHFMLARFDALPVLDTFELMMVPHQLLREQGYEYIVTEASHQWTGAAFEAEGAVRVHYIPYRHEKVLPVSADPGTDRVTSPDGYLSDKDSGCMFYVLRLR